MGELRAEIEKYGLLTDEEKAMCLKATMESANKVEFGTMEYFAAPIEVMLRAQLKKILKIIDSFKEV